MMVSTEDDPRAELAALVGALRQTVAWHARGGVWGVSAGATPAPAVVPAAAPVVEIGRRTLAQIREEVGDCQRCKLARTRTKIVFGVGAEDSPLMFVGEAPGADEDRLGDPFVGRAGELLDKMIEAMGW